MNDCTKEQKLKFDHNALSTPDARKKRELNHMWSKSARNDYSNMKYFILNNLLNVFLGSFLVLSLFIIKAYKGVVFNSELVEVCTAPFFAGIVIGYFIMLIKSILFIRKINSPVPKTEFSDIMNKELVNDNLEFARTTLLDLIKESPENGRAFFLLAQISFFQERYDEAKQLVDQAKNKHYEVPDDFIKNLSSKTTTISH